VSKEFFFPSREKLLRSVNGKMDWEKTGKKSGKLMGKDREEEWEINGK